MMIALAVVLVLVPVVVGLVTVHIAFRLIDKLKDVVDRTA